MLESKTFYIAFFGDMMRFLLVNANSAVRKIFNITAKKAAIQLDVVSSIKEIPLKEDYNCIFIDDGVLDSGDIGNFRNKMITTKFCIILAKDSPLVSGFDSYIRKPFLPTDIYEVMKKEKYNDINITSNAYDTPANSTEKVANAPAPSEINANSGIDLSEFSDIDDEFLSGSKDIDFNNNPLDIPQESKKDDIELDLAMPSDLEDNIVGDSADFGDSIFGDSALKDDKADDINLQDSIPLQDSAPKATPPKPAKKQRNVLEDAEAQINNIKALADKGGNFYNSSNDMHNIDFSQVMALQDEILKEEESKKKKKNLIGGDIYKKKEQTPQEEKNKLDSTPPPTQEAKSEPISTPTQDSTIDSSKVEIQQDTQENAQEAEQDFAETLDLLNQNADDSATSAINSAPPEDWTQNFTASQNLTQAAPQDYIPLHNPAQHHSDSLNEDFSFDSLNGEDFDGLDGLSGISDIKSDTIEESPLQPQPKNANDILSNLDITENNIDEDYHADSTNATENSTEETNPLDISDFNNAFSQGINAEMDSIAPSFKSQDFMQDFTPNPQESTQKYNMLGLPIDEDGEIKDINDLSENELEKLDDEALLLLQERALQEKSTTPKVLNKQQIDDINNILEDTQNPPASEFSINNNEFGSLTQEALSEVLGEESANMSDDINIEQDIDTFQPQEQVEPTFQDTQSQNPQSQDTQSKQININENLDIAEIIKTFPIDKLRELLSGVQITINITFPSKK